MSPVDIEAILTVAELLQQGLGMLTAGDATLQGFADRLHAFATKAKASGAQSLAPTDIATFLQGEYAVAKADIAGMLSATQVVGVTPVAPIAPSTPTK